MEKIQTKNGKFRVGTSGAWRNEAGVNNMLNNGMYLLEDLNSEKLGIWIQTTEGHEVFTSLENLKCEMNVLEAAISKMPYESKSRELCCNKWDGWKKAYDILKSI